MSKVQPGINDINTVSPHLVSEWDQERNKTILSRDVAAYSNKKYWWKCTYGHSWLATPNNRSNGYGCPYCSGRRAIKGETDLATRFPELLSEWDYDKNSIDPSDVSAKSNKTYWWKCEKGHSWKDKPCHRARGDGCPFCSGHRVLAGFNDLATLNPSLAKEWSYEHNKPLCPNQITVSSSRKVWWICSEGHTWETSVAHRNTEGTGCPYCSGRFLIKGKNDLKTINPILAAEWDYEKNGILSPCDIAANSDVVVWWKCPVCHNEWKARPATRNRTGQGCPKCSKRNRTSFPEQAIFFYLKQVFVDAQNSYTSVFQNQMELDIYLPSKKTGIEYDGIMHKGKKADRTKYLICKRNGITLIRVSEIAREEQEPICDIMIHSCYLQPQSHGLDATIIELADLLGIKPGTLDINTTRDRMEIYSQYLTKLKENSLASLYPSIASEWHPHKNGDMLPEMFAWGSGTKAWWKCSEGHEWETTIASRTSNGAGCPVCGRKKVKAGQIKAHLKGGDNALSTVRPDLEKQWNYKRNTGIDISQINLHSNQKVWWICSKGHEWQAIVTSRAYGTGCPYCANQKINIGENDLETLYPEVAKLWNYEKNQDLSPHQFAAHSNKKVWWKCEHGHEWQAIISSVVYGKRCPYCSGRKVLPGFNDLATLQPELIAEWDFEKNTSFSPDQVTEHSGKKAWWKCRKGHSWYAVIDSRSRGVGCPECSSKKKAVMNIETGAVYSSLQEAANACGIKSGTSISLCCEGKHSTSGGFHWKYVEDTK